MDDEGEARFTEFELEGWNRLAQPYHERFGKLTSQSVDPLLDAVGATTAPIRLLDVATGPGYLAAAAACDRGADVIGLDFSGKGRNILYKYVVLLGPLNVSAPAQPQ